MHVCTHRRSCGNGCGKVPVSHLSSEGGQDIEVQRRRHLQLAEMEGLVTTLLVTGLSSDLPSSTYLSFITCQALL